MKLQAWIALALAAALLGAGCAGAGRSAGNAGAPAAAFVAPDGARATPNTGASRLADGIAAGIDSPAPPATGTAATGTTATAAAPHPTGDGVVFSYAGSGSTVSLAGEFNNWDMAADPMAKQADGSFRLVKKLEPGRYAYKFVVDGQWQADAQAKEMVDDGFGGKNSVIVVGAASPTAKGASVETPLDIPVGMVMQEGNYDLPEEPPVLLSRIAPVYPDDALKNGVEVTVVVAALIGVDGRVKETKIAQPSNPIFSPAAEAAVRKWVFKPAAAGDGKPQAVWMQIPIRFALDEATPNPVSGKGRAPEVTPGGVRFTFAGPAKSVHLAGDFNAWSISGDPLTRGADGTWTLVRKLPAGTHAYKFVVDGTTWKTDEANPALVVDGFGGKNSTVIVP